MPLAVSSSSVVSPSVVVSSSFASVFSSLSLRCSFSFLKDSSLLSDEYPPTRGECPTASPKRNRSEIDLHCFLSAGRTFRHRRRPPPPPPPRHRKQIDLSLIHI